MFGINLISNIKNQNNNPPTVPKQIELWKIELKEAIRSTQDLSKILKRKIPDTSYPIFIPQRLARKIFHDGPAGPLWKQFIPQQDENNVEGLSDPIGDQVHSKNGKIIHRYKNRILFLPTSICPINCRYCFRKNELIEPESLFKGRLDDTLKYLRENPEVNEVILSGGDPLILSDEKLEIIFRAFSQITSVKYIRLHSRTPIIIPSRITKNLITLFSKYNRVFKKIILVLHTNHSDELDQEVVQAIKLLKNNNVELLSQSVILKDVNDNTKSLVQLFTKLSGLGVRPYYLHHPDRVLGAMHFHLSLTEGRYLYHSLRNELPGWMIPQYVIDIPGGEGKVPAFNPESFDFGGQLINKDGLLVKVNPILTKNSFH